LGDLSASEELAPYLAAASRQLTKRQKRHSHTIGSPSAMLGVRLTLRLSGSPNLGIKATYRRVRSKRLFGGGERTPAGSVRTDLVSAANLYHKDNAAMTAKKQEAQQT